MDSSAGDDRWKLSKKGRSRSGRPHAMDASSAAGTVLSRSYSASVTSSRSSRTSTSTSTSAAAAATGSCSSSSSNSAASSSQQAAAGSSSSRLSKKCVEAVKEHRARFYIVRRCVSMLVCWRDH